MPAVRLSPIRLLAILLLVTVPALAQEDASDAPPEPPLPPTPTELPYAPVGPVVTAPDPAGLLKECKEAEFIDCFRGWKPPPPPPPEDPKKEAAKADGPPLPPDPKAPREPAQPGGNYGGVPPAPNPEADQATYEALVKALKDSGLQDKVKLPPPKDGSTTIQLEPPNRKAPSKP
ncbi:MAG TPA: hypothetical protein VGE72_21415 [Azospirillum sp.]